MHLWRRFPITYSGFTPLFLRHAVVGAVLACGLILAGSRTSLAQPLPGEVIGDDNSTAIGNAPAAWKARGTPVAVIETAISCGTGFLINDQCMLTCAHIQGLGGDVSTLKIWFDYEDKIAPFERHQPGCGRADSACSQPDKWNVTSVTILSATDDLDCALIKIAKKNDKFPGEVYGHVKVRFTDPVEGEKVHVIHHPAGGCKEYSTDDDAKVIKKDDRDCHDSGQPGWFSHGADAESGSSGAPVFDNNGCVLGAHGAGVTVGDITKNCAVKMSAIKTAVEGAGCAFDACATTSTEPVSWGRVKSLFD